MELACIRTVQLGDSWDYWWIKRLWGTKSIYHSRKMMLLMIAVEIWAIISPSATDSSVSRSKSCKFPTTKWTKYHWTAWGQAAVTDKNFNSYRWSATANIWLCSIKQGLVNDGIKRIQFHSRVTDIETNQGTAGNTWTRGLFSTS